MNGMGAGQGAGGGWCGGNPPLPRLQPAATVDETCHGYGSNLPWVWLEPAMCFGRTRHVFWSDPPCVLVVPAMCFGHGGRVYEPGRPHVLVEVSACMARGGRGCGSRWPGVWRGARSSFPVRDVSLFGRIVPGFHARRMHAVPTGDGDGLRGLWHRARKVRWRKARGHTAARR